MRRTLKDYITFLRENHLSQEANFYNTEVVSILKTYGMDSPLEMSTEAVVSTLLGIKDTLTTTLPKEEQVWDVELGGNN